MAGNFTRVSRRSSAQSPGLLVPATGHVAESATDLHKAYMGAIYQVRLPGGRRLNLVLGKALPPALCKLCASDDTSCALITAWNPQSRRTSNRSNHLAMHSLRQQLLQLEPQYCLAAISQATDGDWREVQLFVAGITVADLDRLALNFHQDAILVGTPTSKLTIRHYAKAGAASLNERTLLQHSTE